MKIILTGGAGFIGSHLVQYLIRESDSEILNFDKLTYAANPGSLSNLMDNPRYHFRKSDICDANDVQAAFDEFQPDAVMHLAAESHVDRSIDQPDQFIQTNLVGTYQLLTQATRYLSALEPDRRDHFRFLHVSTDEVYGSLNMGDAAFTENNRYEPHSPYAASKAGSDHLVRAWHTTYGLPTIVTNCSNNYGPNQHQEKLIPTVIHSAILGQPIPVYGTGENVRDWLHVEDHAAALHLVLTKGTAGSTYNIGGDNERTNIQLVNRLCKILDELHPVDKNPAATEQGIKSYSELITLVADRPGHDFRYAIDAAKIQSELGWKPSHDFESGLRETVKALLSNNA